MTSDVYVQDVVIDSKCKVHTGAHCKMSKLIDLNCLETTTYMYHVLLPV